MQFIFFLFFTLSSSHAKDSQFWCKYAGTPTSANSIKGYYDCAEAFVFGQVCFTGSRFALVKIINGGEYSWDKERLEKARFLGSSEIIYEYVDGSNGLRESYRIPRCSTSFFKK